MTNVSATGPAEPLPGASVVIAARNAARTLRACLLSLHALRYDGEYEIIVADDGSDDGTAEIVKSFPGVRLLRSEGRGPSAARNAAVATAAHDIVAFTDADCTVDPGWLQALVVALRDSRAACAGGPQRNVFESGQAEDVPRGPATAGRHTHGDHADALNAFFGLASAVAEYTRGDDRAREVDHNASCNSAYIRHAFDEAGGFSEDLWPGEDVDLDYRLRRLGYRCWYTPDARVDHHRPGTPDWFAGMMRRYGRAQRELVRRHGPFRLLHWMPAAVLAAVLVQLLWLPRATRAAAALIDGVALALAVGVLAWRVPPRLWPDVVRYAAVAFVQWNLGYAEGVGFRVRGAGCGCRVLGAGCGTDLELAHQERWYRDAIASRFFDREGFRRLVSWNLAWLRRAIPFSPDMHVLSLGCGLGEYELALAPRVARIVAVDLSPAAIEGAARRARDAGVSNVEFRVGAFESLGFEAGSFDVIYALGALHHVPSDARVALLRRAAEWLKPGGWFYARDPNARGVLRRLAAPWSRSGRFHSPQEDALDPGRLRTELERAGLRVVAMDYTDVIAGPLPWVANTPSRLFWWLVFGVDRLWLAVPVLRRGASQFAVTARRDHAQ